MEAAVQGLGFVRRWDKVKCLGDCRSAWIGTVWLTSFFQGETAVCKQFSRHFLARDETLRCSESRSFPVVKWHQLVWYVCLAPIVMPRAAEFSRNTFGIANLSRKP